MEGFGTKRVGRRVTRREAAKLLATSVENVRYLQRRGQLRGEPDLRGHYWFRRDDVENLARRRGQRIKPWGELSARVFALFDEGRPFAEVVIETQQEPEVIRRLWMQYELGFRPSED